MPNMGDLVTIVVVRAHDGIEVGFEKKAIFDATTKYMIDNGYWKIK